MDRKTSGLRVETGKPDSRRPAWLAADRFPFESRFLEIDGNTVHFVDEGDGPVTVLMLHGNGTFSFLYRNLIHGLRGRVRCVAVDYPGFGASVARAGYGFTPAEHSQVIAQLIEHLDLDRVVLMVQDWGGPIGLAAAARTPNRFVGLAICNTWAWPVAHDSHFTSFSRLLSSRLGRHLILRRNAFVRWWLPLATSRRLPPDVRAMYRAPFSTGASRTPTYVLPGQIVTATAWLEELESRLPLLAHLPALLMWGTRDLAFRWTVERVRFEQLFPDHVTVELRDAKHYVQEDAPADMNQALRRWLPRLTES